MRRLLWPLLSVVLFSLPSITPAQSTTLSVDLVFGGSPSYCSPACVNATTPSAGTVTVSEVSAADSYLHFDVNLTGTKWVFMTNRNFSFAFGLDVTGATLSNITASPTGATWDSPTNFETYTRAGGRVGGRVWSYGLLATPTSGHRTNTNDLQFDVLKSGYDLSLSDLVTTRDKNGVALLFIADVRNPNGKNGYVGALMPENAQAPVAIPLPGTLPLLAGGFGLIGLLARRRCKRAAV